MGAGHSVLGGMAKAARPSSLQPQSAGKCDEQQAGVGASRASSALRAVTAPTLAAS